MQLKESFLLNIEKNGVANLIFDLQNEKVNKLSSLAMTDLERAISVIDGNKAIRVLVITSAKANNFIAGADINEIKSINNREDALQKVKRGQDILNKIANLKIPSIAVINGSCLGGGLELALACSYRVAIINKKTILGLPEVNLGIIPGFGGTQRLPKLIGLKNSLNLILSGKSIDAKKAFEMGVVDELMRSEFFEEKLSLFVTEILYGVTANKYLERRNKIKNSGLLEKIPFGKNIIYNFAEKELYAKTKGNYPAPFKALQVIKKTYSHSLDEKSFACELDNFCDLVTEPIAKNLIELFFTNEMLKKEFINNEDESKEVNNVAVIGAGVMGGAIAWLFANNNIDVRIKDISQQAIATGYLQMMKIFSYFRKRRKINDFEMQERMNKVTSNIKYEGFGGCNIAIEAVVEDMKIKKTVLADLENQLSSDAIIVSNTSSLSISEMATALKSSHRFAGMHFFNPVDKMPLVEVIAGVNTNQKTIATIVNLARKLGKTPIVVSDVAGFLVNRVLIPCLNEAVYMFQEGNSIEKIDAIIEKFGMPMGPFALVDVVGIDVGAKVAISLEKAYGERMKVPEMLDFLYHDHQDLLGKKSGKGFYVHQSNNKNKVNPRIYSLILELNEKYKFPQSSLSEQEIINRFMLQMINESAKTIEEKVITNPRYLDMAMIMGAGFPAFRGGVLKYADDWGLNNVVEALQELNKKYPKRYEISPLLIKMAENNQKFII